MKATDIATALRGNPGEARLHELVRACDARRTAIRARLEAIVQVEGLPPPPARDAALRAGLEAVEALDNEVDALRREFTYCDHLESRANEQAAAIKTTAAREAAPGARRRLPAELKRVHAVLAELDAAMDAVRVTMEPLAAVASLDGRLPLEDAELAALLEAREAVWKPRTLATLTVGPHQAAEFPRAFRVAYDVSRDAQATIRPRMPPHRVHLTDIGEATWR